MQQSYRLSQLDLLFLLYAITSPLIAEHHFAAMCCLSADNFYRRYNIPTRSLLKRLMDRSIGIFEKIVTKNISTDFVKSMLDWIFY